jgi:hypothetical protein
MASDSSYWSSVEVYTDNSYVGVTAYALYEGLKGGDDRGSTTNLFLTLIQPLTQHLTSQLTQD